MSHKGSKLAKQVHLIDIFPNWQNYVQITTLQIIDMLCGTQTLTPFNDTCRRSIVVGTLTS